MTRRLPALLSLMATALWLAPMPASPDATRPQVGVGLSPAHFPNQSSADVEAMFKEAAAVGTAGVMLGRWDDPGVAHTMAQMSGVADREGLTAIAQLDIFEPGGTRVAPPAGISGDGFDGDAARSYTATLEEIAAQHPAYIIAAADVNRLLASGTERLARFAQVYKQAYAAIKRISPPTKVTVSFDLGIFRNVHEHGVPYADVAKLVDLFRPALDVVAFAATPSEATSDPSALPDDYLAPIQDLRGTQAVVLAVGWSGAAEAQAKFIERLPALIAGVEPSLLLWPLLHDIDGGGPAADLGLYTADDREKPGAALLRSVGAGTALAARPQADAGEVIAPRAETPRRVAADTFKIAASTLGGAPPTLLASDPHREINHARVSPDGTQFVFTRYAVTNRAGEALEVNGYQRTEIVVCRMDGTACSVVVPARRGIVAANASWTPDGRGLLFVSNATASREPGLALLDLASGRVTMLTKPAALAFADPQQVGGTIVSAGKDMQDPRVSRLFLFDVGSMKHREITDPRFSEKGTIEPPLGDHDPKLSPDGRYVAAMRHLDRDDWGIVVVDTQTGANRLLSPDPHPVDAVPEWSSDGRSLIFWHVDRADLPASGLYTMRPDGAERRRVPLPPGNFYTMPAFFPGAGSGLDARIIYSARPDPRM